MPRKIAKEKMVVVTLHLPPKMLDDLDEAVRQGIFPSRSEAVRYAITRLIERYVEATEKHTSATEASGAVVEAKDMETVREKKNEEDIPWDLLVRGR